MDKERKITCDCGSFFEERKVVVEKLKVAAMVCPDCGEETFTFGQMNYLLKLKRLQEALRSARKIIRVGNSKGITLPESFGQVGDTVFTEPVDEDSVLVRIARVKKS